MRRAQATALALREAASWRKRRRCRHRSFDAFRPHRRAVRGARDSDGDANRAIAALDGAFQRERCARATRAIEQNFARRITGAAACNSINAARAERSVDILSNAFGDTLECWFSGRETEHGGARLRFAAEQGPGNERQP